MIATGKTSERLGRVPSRIRFGFALAMLCAACSADSSAAKRPWFGDARTQWLVQEIGPVGRDDILPAFEESARNYGCDTMEIGARSITNIHGELRGYYGIGASCDEGTIVLVNLVGGRIRIGCAMPTTRQACDRLLRQISQAR